MIQQNPADSLKNENQLDSSNSPGREFKENTDSGEVDPDNVMKNFQNKFESDINLAIDLNENKDNYHVKFKTRSNKLLGIDKDLFIKGLLAVALLITGAVFLDDFLNGEDSAPVEENQPAVSYSGDIPKGFMGLPCSEIFEGKNSEIPKYRPKGTKSLLKNLDCMSFLGEGKAFEKILHENPKVANNEVVGIYIILTRYFKRWLLPSLRSNQCPKVTMSSDCVIKLLNFHRNGNFRMFKTYLKTLGSKKYSSKSYFPSFLLVLNAIITENPYQQQTKFEQAVLKLPQYLPGLKTLFGLIAFDAANRNRLPITRISKQIRDVKLLGDGLFAKLRGLMTKLYITKTTSQRLGVYKEKAITIYTYPELLTDWVSLSIESRDYSVVDQVLAKSISYYRSRYLSGTSLLNHLKTLRYRGLKSKNLNRKFTLRDISTSGEMLFLRAASEFNLRDKSTWAKSYDLIEKAEQKNYISWQFLILKSYLEGLTGQHQAAEVTTTKLKNSFSSKVYGDWLKFVVAVNLMTQGKILKSHQIIKGLLEGKSKNDHFYLYLSYSYEQIGNIRESRILSNKLDVMRSDSEYYKSKNYLYSPFGELTGMDSIKQLGPST